MQKFYISLFNYVMGTLVNINVLPTEMKEELNMFVISTKSRVFKFNLYKILVLYNIVGF